MCRQAGMRSGLPPKYSTSGSDIRARAGWVEGQGAAGRVQVGDVTGGDEGHPAQCLDAQFQYAADGVLGGVAADQGPGERSVVDRPSGRTRGQPFQHQDDAFHGGDRLCPGCRGDPGVGQGALHQGRGGAEVTGGHESLEPQEPDCVEAVELAVGGDVGTHQQVGGHFHVGQHDLVALRAAQHRAVPERPHFQAGCGGRDDGDGQPRCSVRVG